MVLQSWCTLLDDAIKGCFLHVLILGFSFLRWKSEVFDLVSCIALWLIIWVIALNLLKCVLRLCNFFDWFSYLILFAEAIRRLKINDNRERDAAAQSTPYPDRPGEPDCLYYLRTGMCGYGSNCRYNHPANVSLVMQLLPFVSFYFIFFWIDTKQFFWSNFWWRFRFSNCNFLI